MAIVWSGGAFWSSWGEVATLTAGVGEQEALQDRSWNRLFFRRLCVGQVPCRELWTHLTRPGQARPAGKDTLAICLASFLYDVSRRGIGTARSRACRLSIQSLHQLHLPVLTDRTAGAWLLY
jgi:hypothetical protein